MNRSAMFTKFYQTILGRMLLYVVFPTIFIFGLVTYLAARGGFDTRRQAAEERLQAQAMLVAQDIDRAINSATLSAQRMAEAQVAGMFGDRQTSLDYARAVLENYKEITAAYFGYEPNADGKDAPSLDELPAASMDPSGRFIPYWFVAPGQGRTIQLKPLAQMEGLFYAGAKQAFESTKKATAMVTEPYWYDGKMIVEQTYPIVIDGKFAGVAGIDVALADVEAALRQMAVEEDFDIFLISSRGKFIAATTQPELQGDVTAEDIAANDEILVTKKVVTTPYQDVFDELITSRRQLPPIVAADPTDTQRYYFAAAPIKTGGWTVVLRESEDEILAPIWDRLRTRVLIVVGGMAVVVALLVVMTFRLSRRVNLAATVAERVAEGNLTECFAAGDCRDETGSLLRSLTKMNGNLNQLVGQVKRASIQLNSTSTELSATSHQQESTASSFGASANEIAAAVKQISATSNELVETMEQVHQVAVGTAELATDGRANLQAMETNMRGVEQATASIGEKLAVINEKASNITGIVTTITKVADQTNLLSVNAAIEAEKAGEYGVGFLVVAREIRRLADQTAGATLDIDQMVQQMQSAVSAGVMEMDRFTDQVRRSVKDVAEISHQLSEIIERVNANTERFERVNESMQSQSQGADQISQAMGQLTSHATQTAESSREYAQASKELQEAIDSMKSSIATFQLKS